MKKWRVSILTVILLLVAVVGPVAAMVSANYILNWYTPMTTGGASNMSSSNYRLSLTTGQMEVGSGIQSTNYKLNFGYWAGVPINFPTFLPVTQK